MNTPSLHVRMHYGCAVKALRPGGQGTAHYVKRPPKHACIQQAPNLKLAITAGIGSDHVDLNAACEFGLTVAEITGAQKYLPAVCRIYRS